MANQIGRIGYLGLAVEATAGSAEASPDVYLNLKDAPKINEKHEVISDISTYSSRIERVDSIDGKQWMEGSIPINFDMVKSGYLFKLALGNEINSGAGRHDFYPTVSGSTVLSATLFQNRGGNIFDTIPYAVVETLTLNAADGLISLQADIKSKTSTNSSQLTPTTTSGKILSFAHYTAKFGGTIAAAEQASATPLTSFNLVVANNTEMIHQSGSTVFTSIVNKQLKVTGSFSKLFNNAAERDNFLALTKRALVIDFTVPGSSETIKINIPKIVLTEYAPEAGISDIYFETASFEAEMDNTQMEHFITVIYTNSKTTAYA